MIKWVTVILLFISSVVNAQDLAKIKGIVKDSTGLGIPDALVLVYQNNVTTFTNRSGAFEITLEAPNQYTLEISGLNLNTRTLEVNLAKDTLVTLVVQSVARSLPTAIVKADMDRFGIRSLRSVEAGGIYEGKKSDVIQIANIISNKATNNARQAYSKISSLNIWESDQAGLQLDIGGRGLSPKRTTNFNTRQNGYDISADALGYPESYFTPPLQAVEQIEVVRGAGALQYGTQFGGLVNFKLKRGTEDKSLAVESEQTYGSFGLFNSYNAIHGQVGKLNYYTYGHYKRGSGWRENSAFEQYGGFASLNYQATEKLSLGLDLTHMNYLSQQAGGLTDEQFLTDPQESNRDRNFFKVDWNLLALSMDYRISDKLRLYSKTFGLLASRTSLGLLETPNLTDPMSNRDLISGNFQNTGNESRLAISINNKHDLDHILLFGTRLYRGTTDFSQQFGTAGSNADFTVVDTAFLDRRKSNFEFPNSNIALFVEAIVRLSNTISLIPGLRYEYIDTKAQGTYTTNVRTNAFGDFIEREVAESSDQQRHIFLYGLGLSNKFHKDYELYANATANYRAINFSDIQIQTNTQLVDPNIRDEEGFSFDFGIRRRNFDPLYIEAGLFYIWYDNRIGELIDDGLRVRTNIGAARSYGIELFTELDVLALLDKQVDHKFSIFFNGSWNRGVYTKVGDRALVGVRSGNQLEDIPDYNIKTGLCYSLQEKLIVTIQGSFVGQQFSDAANTTKPFVGVFGPIPDYQVMDLSAEYRLSKHFSFGLSINNTTDSRFFTRRALAYPGPGIIPAQGRNWALTLGWRM